MNRMSDEDDRTNGSSSVRNGVWSLKPEWAFAALSLVFGAALVVLTPPFESPDEDAHLRRAYSLSLGHLVAIKRGDYTGDYLPAAVNKLRSHFAYLSGRPEQKTTRAQILASDVSVEPDSSEFVAFSNAAVHPPLPYIPQALGVAIARAITPSVLASLYAGRVLNLLAAVALTFLAIRRTPVGKWAMAVFGLLPMSLALTASLSPDAVTNALCLLFLAQIFWCAAGPTASLSARDVAHTACLGAAVGLAKQAYFLLPLSFLLIPQVKLGSASRYWRGLAEIMGTTWVAVAAWSWVVRRTWSPPDPARGVDPAAQLTGLIADPMETLFVFGRTLTQIPLYVQEFVGRLGSLEVAFPVSVYVGAILFLVGVCIADFGPNAGFRSWQRAIAAAVALLVCMTVVVAIYTACDPVKAPVPNLQGRYFIAVGPLVGIVLGGVGTSFPRFARRVAFVMPAVGTIAVPGLLVGALAMLHTRYYVDTPQDAARRRSLQGELLREKGQNDAARTLFEEALAIDPDCPAAHYSLGLMLEPTDPRAAAEHFQTALKGEPDNVYVLTRLADARAALAEYPEAITLYREAIRLRPESSLPKRLRQAESEQRAMEEKLLRVTQAIQATAAASLGEVRHRGTDAEGLYLKANRSPIAEVGGGFVWRVPSAAGTEVKLSSQAGHSDAGKALPFFACATNRIAFKRVFIFPPPLNAQLLADDDVSWFYQARMADLSEAERAEERAYRERSGLRFPLEKLP
jgi:uncharacterized membrane protein